jgi:LysM repeat protein
LKQTQLNFWLSKDANAQLAVVKEDGQAVRNIDLGWVQSGWNNRYWDGKDDHGKMVPYGRYLFRITLTDVYGNKADSEDRTKNAVVGDVLGKTLKNANLRSAPGTAHAIQQVIPAGTELFIKDENAGWYQVVRVDNRSSGFISKSLVATRTNPGPIQNNSPTNVVQTPQPATYIVQTSETLYVIAKKLGVGLDKLMIANPQVKPENVYTGLVLNVPQKAGQLAVATTYIVQANETLFVIAKKLGVGLDELIKINPQVKPENVYIGLVLKVPQKV